MVVRIGVEAAGHYPRTLVARLQAAGLEVVELNPRAVKDARGQQLLRTLKNDARDCGAMAELLIPGSGRSPQCRDDAFGRAGRLGRAPTPQGRRVAKAIPE